MKPYFFTCSFNVCLYFKLDCEEVEITSGADRRLVCRSGQDARRIRVEHSRALRLSAPTSGHFTRDSARKNQQSIQQVDVRDRRVRTRVLVGLDGGQGVVRACCQRSAQADERVRRRGVSEKCPGKWHTAQLIFLWFTRYPINIVVSFAACFDLSKIDFVQPFLKMSRKEKTSWYLTWTRPQATWQFAKELSDGKKLLKSALFVSRLATFDAFPSIGDAPLGELTFEHMQLPIGTLDTTDFTELKPVELLVPYDFLLPLEHGQRIAAFEHFLDSNDIECFTQMSYFDQLGRLIGTVRLTSHLEQVDAVRTSSSLFTRSLTSRSSWACTTRPWNVCVTLAARTSRPYAAIASSSSA